MAHVTDMVKLALDARHGRGEASKYSMNDTQSALREGLIEMNGGSTKLNPRALRSGAAAEMYAVVEQVIQKDMHDYWTNNEVVNRVCDYRNLSLGDEQSFWIPDNSLFAVATISEGNTNIRRQRYEGGRQFSIPTELRGIKIYEEMIRVMSGRVDFNDMIDMAQKSLIKDTYERIMTAWNSIDSNVLGDEYALPNSITPAVGTYSESKLLDIIAEVEAENNERAVIYGTKKALRTIAPSVALSSEFGKQEMNAVGYVGKFYGTDVVELKQTHKLNSTQMLLDDKTVYVMSSNDKPIKYVTEGEGFILPKEPTSNADLTYEWLYTERTGIGVVVNDKFGKYTFA